MKSFCQYSMQHVSRLSHASGTTHLPKSQSSYIKVVSSFQPSDQQRHRMRLMREGVFGRNHGLRHVRDYSGSHCVSSRFMSTGKEIDEPQVDYDPSLFAEEVLDFHTLGIQSSVLLKRLEEQQYFRPTKVQAASYRAIMGGADSIPPENLKNQRSYRNKKHVINPNNVTIACETGSGKTLAYLLPLLDDILLRKESAAAELPEGEEVEAPLISVGYDYARALILVPNKELAQQVIRMAAPLAGGRASLIYGGNTLPDARFLEDASSRAMPPPPQDVVRMAIMPGGLKSPLDFVPFRQTIALGGEQPPVDLLITTPAAIGPLALSPKHISLFADIQTVVVDEADMLLDGGYIRQLENVLMGFRRADRLDAVKMGQVPLTQHVFVAATLPNYGLRSVDAYLLKKFPNSQRIALDNLHLARHSGLAEPTVWVELESKKERMMRVVELFNADMVVHDAIEGKSLRGEKIMIFLNSVADCDAACEALQLAGVKCAPYHAQIPLEERSVTLERFRKYRAHDSSRDDDVSEQSPLPVLVCTDLAARGLDVPGVTVVVQLQFCGNVVGHLHRMGRCGRGANQRQYGRGFVFYGMKERALVEAVKAAELEQEQMILPGEVLSDWNDENAEYIGDANSDSFNSSDSSKSLGKVTPAFSRRRGFRKKLKKMHRGESDTQESTIEQQ